MFFHNLFTILMPEHMSFLFIFISFPLEQTKKLISLQKFHRISTNVLHNWPEQPCLIMFCILFRIEITGKDRIWDCSVF